MKARETEETENKLPDDLVKTVGRSRIRRDSRKTKLTKNPRILWNYVIANVLMAHENRSMSREGFLSYKPKSISLKEVFRNIKVHFVL